MPPNIVMPVSATIAGSAKDRALYDEVLEVVVTRPFMRAYANGYRFGAHRVCADGVETNFEFLLADDAQHVWRYLDLTAQARCLSELLRQTVEHEMAEEALPLRQHDAARAAIKRWVEMPDADSIHDVDNEARALLVRTLRGVTGAVQNAFVTISDKAEGCAPLSVRTLADGLVANLSQR